MASLVNNVEILPQLEIDRGPLDLPPVLAPSYIVWDTLGNDVASVLGTKCPCWLEPWVVFQNTDTPRLQLQCYKD